VTPVRRKRDCENAPTMVIKSACPEKPHAAGNPTSLQTMSETEAGSGAGKEGVGLGGGVVVVEV